MAKEAPVLMPDRFQQAEYKLTRWTADVEAGRTVEDILEPGYWAHVASQMQPYDEIVARAEDGQWIAYLIVRFSEKSYANVYVDRVITFKDNAVVPEGSTKHKVEWKGHHYRFAVIRLADSKMLHSGCKTREEASSWLKNHEQAH